MNRSRPGWMLPALFLAARFSLSTVHAQSTPCVLPPLNLSGWWRAEGNALDVTGTNNGTVFPGAEFDLGFIGQAFQFTGATNSYVEVPDSASLRGSEVTIEFWVKRLSLDFSGHGADYVVEKGGDWTGGQVNYGVALHNPSYNYCLHFTFAGGWRGAGSIPDTNTWHHCAVVARNGDTDPTFYIDGVQQPVQYREGALTVNLVASTRQLHIGAMLDPVRGYFYYGRELVDELAIYSRALSAAEIQAIYNAGMAGKCVSAVCTAPPTNIVGWWRAEGQANDAAGTNFGMMQPGASFAQGVVGGAFQFTGARDSYIEVPNSPVLQATSAVTIEFWVRRLSLDFSGHGADYILEKGGDWTGQQVNYGVALHNPGYNYCLHFTFAGGWRGGGTIGDTNSWHHCAVVAQQGQGNPALYVDGTPQPVLFGEGAGAINLYPSVQPLHIGAMIDPRTGYFYYGRELVDELAIYNRALSAEEIRTIYLAGVGGKCTFNATLLAPEQLGAGGVRLIFLGNPQFNYTLQRSPALDGPWTNLGAAATDQSGRGIFLDPNPPAPGAYYRTLYP